MDHSEEDDRDHDHLLNSHPDWPVWADTTKTGKGGHGADSSRTVDGLATSHAGVPVAEDVGREDRI